MAVEKDPRQHGQQHIERIQAKTLLNRVQGMPFFPRTRLETLRQLRLAGVRAGLFLAPILPFLTDRPEGWEPILAKAVTVQASFVIPSLLRLDDQVKAWYLSTVERHFPAQLQPTAALYRRGQRPHRGYGDRVMQQVTAAIGAKGLSRRDDLYKQQRSSQREMERSLSGRSGEQLAFDF